MNIYVGNLDYRVDDQDLVEVFEDYGTVNQTKVITDRDSGRSKGFGFVTMDSKAEAKKAIEELNGATYEERRIVVNEAKPKKSSV
jgi:RNA recognition motif-containing protein